MFGLLQALFSLTLVSMISLFSCPPAWLPGEQLRAGVSRRAGSEPHLHCCPQGCSAHSSDKEKLQPSIGFTVGDLRATCLETSDILTREQNVLRAKSSQIYTHRACSSCLSLLHSWEPSPREGKQLSQGLAEEQGTS